MKKPFYKRKWFIVVVILFICAIGSALTSPAEKEKQTETAETKTEAKTTEAKQEAEDDFISAVKKCADDGVGEGEKITDIGLNDNKVVVSVDMSGANTTMFSVEELAVTRAQSITDLFLDLTEYDGKWDSITIDFGDVGHITKTKDDIEVNEYDMKCFNISDSDLLKD